MRNYKITLERMEFRANHGCYDLEQVVGNRFSVDLKITTHLPENDDVTEAVNYLEVYETVAEQMKVTRRTIEAVAKQINEAVMARFEAVYKIECKVSKLAPPLGGKVASVSVEVKRTRERRI
ncbi:MAG: dihydroneopterin aldolase [Rikenellaceae bacterium]